MCYTNGQREMKNTGRRKETFWKKRTTFWKKESITLWGTRGHMYTWYQAQIDQGRSKMCQGEQFSSKGGEGD